jgi:polyferredoxin
VNLVVVNSITGLDIKRLCRSYVVVVAPDLSMRWNLLDYLSNLLRTYILQLYINSNEHLTVLVIIITIYIQSMSVTSQLYNIEYTGNLSFLGTVWNIHARQHFFTGILMNKQVHHFLIH